MIEHDAELTLAILVATGVMLYGLFWWMVDGLPLGLRWLARIMVALVVAIPVTLGTLTNFDTSAPRPKMASAPRDAASRPPPPPRPTAAPRRDERPMTSAPPAPSASEPPATVAGEPPARSPAPEPVGGSGPPVSSSGPGAAGSQPPMVSPPPLPTAPAPTRSAAGSRQPEPKAAARAPVEVGERERAQPALIPPPSDQPWVLVPVLYGTDRNRRMDNKRITYGSDRTRQLELGMAEVTIPTTHQVPNIERPWTVKIPYLDITLYQETEDPKKHFTIKDMRVLNQSEFILQARQRLAGSKRYKDHAVVFIHGYNNGFEHALFRTAQIAYDIDFDGLPMMYSWPSGGGYTSYNYDRESAVQSEPHMRKFLEMTVRETGAKSVSIIAHSMGSLPLLQVLRDLQRSLPEDVRLSQIVLAAPDVDRDVFANLAAEIKSVARGMTLYAAANDTALMVSRQVAGGVPRAGEVPATGPMVLPGIDTIDVTAANTEVLSARHNHYAQSKDLLDDIGKLLLTNVRPPKQRLDRYEVVPTPAGDYWRYPGAR